ncbi:hypothetical protein [Salmonella enterica]|uniref:hypothetical protein n=1 Tax=Salmonella enterica TaxID=28901 RepID=UPI00098EF6D8|nr:hypothetical protein [Salmonella enterica]
MTTITREQQKQILIDTANHVISRDNTSPYSENLRELARIALAALTAEPVRYLNKFSGVCVTLEQQPNAADDVAVYMPLYAAPPVQETGIYKDMLNIISLLEKNEWAEHCTSTVLGSLLESEITRLVSKEQPTPIVPESISVRQAISALESADSVTTIGQAYKMGWNACRAAMLQGVEQPQNARQNIPENIPDGNSPAIPDDWVMVPKKLTAENGAKSLLSGEFLETTFISCPECFADEECESCDGSGRIKIEVPVSWTTIKAIWNKGVEHFVAAPQQGTTNL